VATGQHHYRRGFAVKSAAAPDLIDLATYDPDDQLRINPNMGMINPNMGLKSQPTSAERRADVGLADALFTKVQQRVLAVLFGNSGRSFYANEIIALAESGTGAVQRELAKLAAVGLITMRRQGNQKHYQANALSPVFNELRGLVLKTFGLADIVRTALSPLAPRIRAAFIYGSVAKAQDTATSDVDLMVVSDTVTYADVFSALEKVSSDLGRTVNPTVYTVQEFDRRVYDGKAFVTRVMKQPKLWLIGDERGLAA
jgi:predicted nucleotidyltransferase